MKLFGGSGLQRLRRIHPPCPCCCPTSQLTSCPLSRRRSLWDVWPTSLLLPRVSHSMNSGPTLSGPEVEVTQSHGVRIHPPHTHSLATRVPAWSTPYSPPQARPSQGHWDLGGNCFPQDISAQPDPQVFKKTGRQLHCERPTPAELELDLTQTSGQTLCGPTPHQPGQLYTAKA